MDEDGVVALHWACYSGNVEMISCLLAHGAQHDAADVTGCRPICLTSKHGHLQAMRTLLHTKACVHTVDQQGRNCLMLAASMGHFDLVRLLLLYGADPVVEDVSGLSALDHARVGKHGVALDVMLQSCIVRVHAFEKKQKLQCCLHRVNSFQCPEPSQDEDPGYSDSYEAHQTDIYLRLNREVVSDIFERLMSFKQRINSAAALELSGGLKDGVRSDDDARGLCRSSGLSQRVMTDLFLRLDEFQGQTTMCTPKQVANLGAFEGNINAEAVV